MKPLEFSHRLSRKKFLQIGASAAGLYLTHPPAMAHANNPMTDTNIPSSKDDFNFLVGNWNIKNRKLSKRLSGSTDWLEFEATGEMVRILNGTGNTDNFIAMLGGKPFEGRTLRLFDPSTKLWSIYWADSLTGRLATPTLGAFDGNLGNFYADDQFESKPIKVMFQWDKTNSDSPVWSQAFSDDHGKTWEYNWYMTFYRSDKNDSNQILKVLELRNYLLKPGSLDQFTAYFQAHFVDAQTALDGYLLGQYKLSDSDAHFFWLRGFTDMAARLNFLKSFYDKSAAWKKYGPGANEMIADSDHVHLLRPVNITGDYLAPSDGVILNMFFTDSKLTIITYYTARDGNLGNLIERFRAKNPTPPANLTLWISEMTKSEFRHPIIQNSNLLVSIISFKDEADYHSYLGSKISNTWPSDNVSEVKSVTLISVKK